MEQTAASTFSTIHEQNAAHYTVRTGQTQSIGSLGRAVGTCQYNRKRIFHVTERQKVIREIWEIFFVSALCVLPTVLLVAHLT